MKLKSLLTFSLIALSSGFFLSCLNMDIRDRGEDCPPRDENGHLTGELIYIGIPSCTKDEEECIIEGEKYHFSDILLSSFPSCPLDFPKCKQINEDSNYYYCDKSEKIKCPDNNFLCESQLNAQCVDPNSPFYCGANDCDAKNFGGIDCREYDPQSTCGQLSDGSYACFCQGGAILCDGHCIHPSDRKTCGAYKCGIENYGGDDCTKYANTHECVLNKEEDVYQCQPTQCLETQCSTENSYGQLNCVNTDEMCGPECQDCTNIHADTTCMNGKCIIKNCLEGEHPIFEGTHIVRCERNSDTACASFEKHIEDPIVNCNDNAPEHASSMGCSKTGQCFITSCETGYRLSSDNLTCIPNTTKECGADISEIKDCTSIPNSASTECTESGSCIVLECAAGYHLNKDHTGCIESTVSECAPTTGDTPRDCTAIEHNVTPECAAGVCKVKKCQKDYHLNADNTGCIENSAEYCAKTDSNAAVACTGPAKYCVSGACSCSTDGETVLNWNGSACVHKACLGVPGVMTGSLMETNYYSSKKDDFACNATKCASGFTQYTQKPGSTCRYDSKTNCPGYVSATCNGCVKKNGKDNCSHSNCKSGYRYYKTACLEQDICCGTRNTGMSKASDFACKNCRAQGKKCNISSGNCE